MTRDAILAMKPGRELDKAVALAVMGWTEHEGYGRPLHTHATIAATGQNIPHDDWENKGPHSYLESPDGDRIFLCPCGNGMLEGLPCYSTDIAAAWEVIAHLYSEGWYWYMGIDEEGPFFRLILRGAGEDGADLMASCDGVQPEDICMTALLAMEEQPMG